MWRRIHVLNKEAGAKDDRYYHLVLLAENNQGYANLMKIVSKAFVEGFYYKPRVDLELLNEYHEGIIALTPAWQESPQVSGKGAVRRSERGCPAL